jgi:hypothetical protein
MEVSPVIAEPISLHRRPFVESHTPESIAAGFRSEAEIKALRILDDMEEEQNDQLLMDMGGKRCARRQRRIYSQTWGRDSVTFEALRDLTLIDKS